MQKEIPSYPGNPAIRILQKFTEEATELHDPGRNQKWKGHNNHSTEKRTEEEYHCDSTENNCKKPRRSQDVATSLKLKRNQKATLKPVLQPLTSGEKITYKSSNTKIAIVNIKDRSLPEVKAQQQSPLHPAENLSDVK